MQSKSNSSNQTLHLNGRLLDLSRPRVMGIINATPDSFYSESRRTSREEALRAAENMIAEGADLLDIGGYSSRPGASEVTLEEELNRVLPVIESIHRAFPEVPLSVDTFRSQVAQSGLEAGACLVNDITAGLGDPQMFSIVGSQRAAMILMHMRGTPATMGTLTSYENVTKEVATFLEARIREAESAGIHEIIVDPGFGFAKTVDQNFEMLRNLSHFLICGRPVLAGFSRKSMIWKTLGTDPSQALNGTTALNMAALMNKAGILRVHDVKPAVECVRLFCHLENYP